MHFPVWQLGRKIIDCCDKSVFFLSLFFFVVIHGRVYVLMLFGGGGFGLSRLVLWALKLLKHGVCGLANNENRVS